MKRRRPEHHRPLAAGTVLLLASCLLGLAGCETIGARHDGEHATLAARFEALQQLAQADEPTQAAILAARRTDYEATHSANATLDYALALALPGPALHDPALSQRLFEGLLTADAGLEAGERALATVSLAQLDAELKAQQQRRTLEGESQQLRDAQAAARTATARRLLAEIEENARLRRLLDEARTKLDAVADIAKGRK